MKTRNSLNVTLCALALAGAMAVPSATLAGDAPGTAPVVKPGGRPPHAGDPMPPIVLNPGRLPVVNGPDMAARSIQFRLAERTRPGSGRMLIVGQAINLGNRGYNTPTQQELQLKENGRVVARSLFRSVAPGQTVEVRYELSWNAGDGKGRSYQLVVAYEPDDHDTDTNYGNNILTRGGADGDAQFR